MLTLTAPAQAGAAPGAAGTGRPDPGDQIVRYDHDSPLANASLVRLRGTPTGNGGCALPVPQLRLEPDETAVAARQISTNFTDCSTVVEIGTPVTREDPPAGVARETVDAVPVTTAEDAAIAATSSSGYYRVWWEDVINLDVHQVKSNISWTWDNFCVGPASGSANFSWLAASGWSKRSGSAWLSNGCSVRQVFSNAEYENGFFCWPAGTVRSYYVDVTVSGWFDGVLLGRVSNTWTTYPPLCPHLHYNTELRRVTG
jgi:hypothetical protein